jgi:hypothetical protein
MAIEPFGMEDGEKFSPEILAAFESYPSPSPSKGFEATFWSQFETRRSRYRGLLGSLRRIWELEIEGVVVWRLAASTITGGLSCLLVLGVLCGSTNQPPTSSLPKSPIDIPSSTPTVLAFHNREWERELAIPKAMPKTAPPRTPEKTKEFSWNISSANLA